MTESINPEMCVFREKALSLKNRHMTTDTFPKIETHIWWWIYFPMKFRTFISLATPWRMNLVLFFNAPLRVAVILLVGLWAGVAESNCFIAVLTFLPQGEGARQGGWGDLAMQSCQSLTHRLRRSPLSQSKRDIFFGIRFCDFAFRLRAEWQGCFSYDRD